MIIPAFPHDQFLRIYLALSQYPILSSRIRARMRRELFESKLVDAQSFEAEVREKAILSQKREGLQAPWEEETIDLWEARQKAIRDQLTDIYYSNFRSIDHFEKLVHEVLQERGVDLPGPMLSINPELAPQDLLFEQAMRIQNMPEAERGKMEPRLREIKVVLIRNMISDQLAYINIAKEWLTVSDLVEIRRRKIGSGRIGGKAAGMLLAYRILHEVSDDALRDTIRTPDSYYAGSDLFYTFMSTNNLVHWNDQKYKSEGEMRAEYPVIQDEFSQGDFPPDVVERLEGLLINVGNQPLIVRSSSLLEDNFGTAFAGKYESYFCPNQSSLSENLRELTQAIARVYASAFNPQALLYRRSKGLQDYDERMAALIQVVQGEKFGRFYLPEASGVAFSRNLYRWSPQIRREDGFVRLVWGLGTRAVDRVGNDHPRLVALSHPTLRPSSAPKMIRRYSQQYVDLIDLEENAFKTLPIQEALKSRYPPLRYLVQVDHDGYFSSLRSNVIEAENPQLTITFEDMLARTPFADHMRKILRNVEQNYKLPVDMEFTAQISDPNSAHPGVVITILQCRPQSQLREAGQTRIPPDLPRENIAFATHFMVPQGYAGNIHYILFVSPGNYFSLPTAQARVELSRAIGKLNAALAEKSFICVGPGRWGTSNTDLGVDIDYADIYNAAALIELTGQGVGLEPEPSFGTHFFQDMMEAQIYPLAVNLDDIDAIFNTPLFYETPNRLSELLQVDEILPSCLRLIKVADFRPDHHLELVMDDEKSAGICFLAANRA